MVSARFRTFLLSLMLETHFSLPLVL